MAESVDARDLKSREGNSSCGFDSLSGHRVSIGEWSSGRMRALGACGPSSILGSPTNLAGYGPSSLPAMQSTRQHRLAKLFGLVALAGGDSGCPDQKREKSKESGYLQ